MSEYYIATVCSNGHPISYAKELEQSEPSKFCSICGEKAIDCCESCKSRIKGMPRDVVGIYEPPSYCSDCGRPMSWTQRKAETLELFIEELDELNEKERASLTISVPDLIANTAGSGVAVLRYKKVLTKLPVPISKVLQSILEKVCVETIKSKMGI